MIRNRLSEIMGARRLSQRDVERGTGLAYKTVNKFYNDRLGSFDREALSRICAFLGVGVGELLVFEPDDGEGADSPGRGAAGAGV